MRIDKKLIAILFLLAATLISYANIFQNEFVWDDEFFIVENIGIKEIKISEFFAEPSTGNLYRPVRAIFYAISYRMWGLNEFGYHLNSFLLHFFITVALFFIALKLTGKTLFSFIAALFFAVHPIHTERITNMTGAFDALGILFFLLSFLFYINFSKENSKKYYYLSILFYLLAIFSTEEAITLILILLLYEFSFNYGISFENTKSLLKKYIPYIVITFFYLVIRSLVVRQLGRTEFYFEHSFFGTLLTTVKIFVQYIFLMFFPINLNIEHYVKFETSIFSIGFLLSLAILLLVFYFFIKSYSKSRLVFFSVGWFFIALLPFTNLLPQATIMAERYLYLPSFGFCILLTILLFKIKKINFLKNHSKYSKIIAALLIILITLSYAALTIKRNFEWKDDFTLLNADAKKNPYGTRIQHALALQYRSQEDYENAFNHASKAVELSSNNYNAYENLGTILAYQKKYDEAIEFYKKSLEINPKFYLALNNLGLVYSYIGDFNNSIFYLEKAIDINPKLAKAHNDLGTVYAQVGDFDLAIEEIEKAIKINKYEADYFYNLAVIYEFLNNKTKAKELLSTGLGIEPGNEKIKNRLARLR